MKVLRGLRGLRPVDAPTALTLGNFDGVHRGHQSLIAEVKALASRHGLRPGVVLFEPHPAEHFGAAHAPRRLSSLRQKLGWFRAAEIPLVLVLRFDAQLAALPAATFVRDVLCQRLRAGALLIGDDWRFGRGREGDYQLLLELSQPCGFELQRQETVTVASERVSSSRVRALLAAGEVVSANVLLTRPWAVQGRVVAGAQLGRTIGAPTANIHYRRPLPLRQGVYHCWLDGRASVANFGTRPTVDGTQPALEVHVLDRELQLYNQRVNVEFGAYLRPEQRFADLAALAAQIQVDFAESRQWHAAHPHPNVANCA